jgi:hypothetical protein
MTERMRGFDHRREECVSGGDVGIEQRSCKAQLNVPMVQDGDETTVLVDIRWPIESIVHDPL